MMEDEMETITVYELNEYGLGMIESDLAQFCKHGSNPVAISIVACEIERSLDASNGKSANWKIPARHSISGKSINLAIPNAYYWNAITLD